LLIIITNIFTSISNYMGCIPFISRMMHIMHYLFLLLNKDKPSVKQR